MENEKIKHKERINYVKEICSDGRVAYVGQSVNHGCCCSSWESVEDLEHEMNCMLRMWLNHCTEELENGLEMKELTEDEWLAKDDNIDYWEVERFKRILQRPSIQKMLLPELTEMFQDSQIAKAVLDTLINTKAHEGK